MRTRLRRSVRVASQQLASTIAFTAVMGVLVLVMFVLLGYRVHQKMKTPELR